MFLLQETLKHAIIAYALHSTYSTYARVKSILINKSASVSIKHIKMDPGGYFIVLVFEYTGKPYTMVNLYIHHSFTKTVFERILGVVLEITKGPLIIAGNFKTVLDNSVDRLGGLTHPPTTLGSYLDKFDLVDDWRWKHFHAREYY